MPFFKENVAFEPFNAVKMKFCEKTSSITFSVQTSDKVTGADPAFFIRNGTNSEMFVSDIRKLFKKGKFFIVPTVT